MNRYQTEIVYSKEKCVFLTASYGAGKSLVIYRKIKLLEKSLKDKDLIYYVNVDGKSGLDSDFKVKIKPSEKVKVVKGFFHLFDTIRHEILPNEEENDIRAIHLMVDEYDTQSLSEGEASQLREIFTNQVQFKNSAICTAAQPIEISRVIFQEIEGKKAELLEEGHILGELKEIMTVYKLEHVMRATKQIYKLASIT